MPSHEAIDKRKGNIGSIVTKIKDGANLRLIPTSNYSRLVLKSKLVLTSKCVLTSKIVPTSKLVPLILLKLLIDGTASDALYQRRCGDKIGMVPNFHHEYVSMDLGSKTETLNMSFEPRYHLISLAVLYSYQVVTVGIGLLWLRSFDGVLRNDTSLYNNERKEQIFASNIKIQKKIF